jgi:hypothetical protein
MKTCTTYLMMAALAVAGVGMSVRAADMATDTNNTGAQMQQTGSQMADESTTKDIRETLVKIVNDGATKNDFNSFLSYLSKPDRERVGSASKSNLDLLNAAIDQFRQDFKSKYNHDFDLSVAHLTTAMIYAGQDKKSATVSFANPEQTTYQPMVTTPTSNTPASGNMTPKGGDLGVAQNNNGSTNTNTNMNNANMAAMASLTLNLINEGTIMNEWRVNAPQRSLEQIKQNLTRQIQMLDDQKAAWPTDVNMAYQAAAYHILEAFNDTTMASDR